MNSSMIRRGNDAGGFTSATEPDRTDPATPPRVRAPVPATNPGVEPIGTAELFDEEVCCFVRSSN